MAIIFFLPNIFIFNRSCCESIDRSVWAFSSWWSSSIIQWQHRSIFMCVPFQLFRYSSKKRNQYCKIDPALYSNNSITLLLSFMYTKLNRLFYQINGYPNLIEVTITQPLNNKMPLLKICVDMAILWNSENFWNYISKALLRANKNFVSVLLVWLKLGMGQDVPVRL